MLPYLKLYAWIMLKSVSAISLNGAWRSHLPGAYHGRGRVGLEKHRINGISGRLDKLYLCHVGKPTAPAFI